MVTWFLIDGWSKYRLSHSLFIEVRPGRLCQFVSRPTGPVRPHSCKIILVFRGFDLIPSNELGGCVGEDSASPCSDPFVDIVPILEASKSYSPTCLQSVPKIKEEKDAEERRAMAEAAFTEWLVRVVLHRGKKLRSIYVKMLVNGCSTYGWLDPIPPTKITITATKCLAVSIVTAAEFCKLFLRMIPP
uniref:DUF630 domain-containing protein n=1 Tax=Ascaris lumbricoides TaxID=6252 RepID=A0A0M3HRS8_ASCLU